MIEIKGTTQAPYPLKGEVHHHLFVHYDDIRMVQLSEDYGYVTLRQWGDIPADMRLKVDLDRAQSIVKQVDILMKGHMNS